MYLTSFNLILSLPPPQPQENEQTEQTQEKKRTIGSRILSCCRSKKTAENEEAKVEDGVVDGDKTKNEAKKKMNIFSYCKKNKTESQEDINETSGDEDEDVKKSKCWDRLKCNRNSHKTGSTNCCSFLSKKNDSWAERRNYNEPPKR